MNDAPKPKTSFTFKLSDSEQTALIRVLKQGNYRPVQKEYTRIAVEGEKFNVALYTSGKCLVQGKGSEEFVTFILEPMVLGRASVGYEDVLNPEAIAAHMGVDESGKGDYFGPMVTAAAYIDPDLAEEFRKLDVKDSKSITSDKKALAMGAKLRELLGKRYAVVKIGPQAYNRLYAKMRSVNRILAWAHARAIENLLNAVPSCPRAISDQFGSKQQVERALMKNGRSIELIQRHKAESDLAVAAASIIAREGFLTGLAEMGEKHGVKLPKGASNLVQDAAVELIKAHRPQILLETAKCHFRTTDVVLGKVGEKRESLGPEGQVVSKVSNGQWHRPKKDAGEEA